MKQYSGGGAAGGASGYMGQFNNHNQSSFGSQPGAGYANTAHAANGPVVMSHDETSKDHKSSSQALATSSQLASMPMLLTAQSGSDNSQPVAAESGSGSDSDNSQHWQEQSNSTEMAA